MNTNPSDVEARHRKAIAVAASYQLYTFAKKAQHSASCAKDMAYADSKCDCWVIDHYLSIRNTLIELSK